MGSTHGSNTIITVGGTDISTPLTTSELTRKREVHKTTGYGAKAHRYTPGLQDNAFKMGGWYDTTASTGSRAILQALADSTSPAAVTIVRKPEGSGSGKPQETFSAILNSYVETNDVDDIVMWTSDWTIDGTVATTSLTA